MPVLLATLLVWYLMPASRSLWVATTCGAVNRALFLFCGLNLCPECVCKLSVFLGYSFIFSPAGQVNRHIYFRQTLVAGFRNLFKRVLKKPGDNFFPATGFSL